MQWTLEFYHGDDLLRGLNAAAVSKLGGFEVYARAEATTAYSGAGGSFVVHDDRVNFFPTDASLALDYMRDFAFRFAKSRWAREVRVKLSLEYRV
jgi:hypothetical protein